MRLALPLTSIALLFTFAALAQAAEPAQPDPSVLLAQNRNTVARVFCRGNAGAGFLLRDRFHIATEAWLVKSGRNVRVVFGDGTNIDGTVVSIDDTNDLAMVKLDQAAPGTPLRVAARAPNLGDPVTVVAPVLDARWDQMDPVHDWVVTHGHVAGISTSFIKADVALPDASEGAPVLGPDGAVIGMVTQSGSIALVTPAEPIRAMEAPKGDESPYHGRFVPGLHLAYQMHVPSERVIAHGFSWGLHLVAWDQLTISQRIGFGFSGMIPREDTEVVERQYAGLNFDLEVGYRLLLTPPDMVPLHLTFGAGATYQQQGGYERIAKIDGDRVVTERREFEDRFVRPTFGVGLLTAGVLDLDYMFELDPKDVSSSGHRVMFGLTF